MGWQEDEVVSRGAQGAPVAPAAAQPAWAQDEVVSRAAPPPVRPPPAEQPSLLSRAGRFYADYLSPATVIEPAANLATNIVSTPLAGLAGITAAGLNATGLDQTSPAESVRQVQDALTYQPKTKGGQAITNAIGYPFQKLAQLGDRTGDVFGESVQALPVQDQTPVSYSPGSGGWPMQGRANNPLVATAINTAVQSAPSLFMRGPKGRVAAAAELPKAAPATALSPRQALFNELNAKGLKVSPSQLEGATVGNVVEGMAGRAKSERGFSMKNASRINELVGEDVGLKGAKAITEADITRLKVEGNKPYNAIAQTGVRKTSDAYRQEIRNIGNRTGGESFAGDVPADIVKLKKYYESRPQFTAQDAVNKIRQLRAEGTKNIKAVNAPEQNAKGHVQRAIADALDNELTRHVESLGKPELAAEYKAARVQLAKVHTLEDALDGSHVSAKSLAQALDRGAPLSGNMELIARAYKEFDRSFQDYGKIRDSNPFSVLDAGAGVVGASASPPLLAAVLARPAARAILASDRYQRSLARGAKSEPKARTDGASKTPLAAPVAASAPRSQERRK